MFSLNKNMSRCVKSVNAKTALSLTDQVFLVEQMFHSANIQKHKQKKLVERFHNTHIPYYNTVQQLIAKLHDNGSVVDMR